MSFSQYSEWIRQHFVPAPGGRYPEEEELAIFTDLAQRGDRLVAEPTRQVILRKLLDGGPASNAVLLELTGQSAGGLATHLGRLEEAGYISVEKLFDERRRPRTDYRITHAGREAVDEHFRKQRAAASINLSDGS